MVRDLNDLTRFVCVSMQGGGNLTGAENVVASQTGYPSPVNLARGYPRYGPGEYNASISLERGEPDAALIVTGDPAAGLSPIARDRLARIPYIAPRCDRSILGPGPDRALPFGNVWAQHSRNRLSHGRSTHSTQTRARDNFARSCGNSSGDREERTFPICVRILVNGRDARMPLTLQYRSGTSLPVEVEGITPDRLRGRSLAEIERLEIHHGNRKVPLAELFTVTGDPADSRIVYEGDLGGVHYIGHGMTGGEIRVMGNAGRHLGAEMTGGTIFVEGECRRLGWRGDARGLDPGPR